MAAEAERLIPDFEDLALIAGKAEEAFYQSDFDEALIYYHKAYLSNNLPEKIKNHCLKRIIQIYLDSGQTENAAQYIERASGTISENPELYYNLARLQAIKGEWVEALESITLLLDIWHQNRFNMTLGISHDAILVFTADLLFNSGDIEGAVQLYTEALKINPDNADACYGAGMCFRDGEALSEAREMFEWALRINPNYIEANIELENLPNA
jgi:tetratricopeptide (TPR) repeat protein